jgi:hypothetical protein
MRDRPFRPVDETRSIIIIVDQIAAFFIACENLRHLLFPPSVQICQPPVGRCA